MKFRYGLVSNSSSSSFIVLKEGKKDPISVMNLIDLLDRNTDYNGLFMYCPTMEFGHQLEKYNHWQDKLDWSFLQIWYTDNENWKENMLKFLQKYNPAIERFKIIESDRDEYRTIGYIDHESVGEDNAIYLSSLYEIEEFIMSPNSWICNQSDNSDWEWKIGEDGEPYKHKWSPEDM